MKLYGPTVHLLQARLHAEIERVATKFRQALVYLYRREMWHNQPVQQSEQKQSRKENIGTKYKQQVQAYATDTIIIIIIAI